MNGELPQNWETVRASDLFGFITSGSRGWAAHYVSEGAKFIRVQNVKRGRIDLDLDDVQHVRPPANAEGARTRLQADDIVVTITADLGRVGLVPPDIEEAYVNQHVALARPVDQRMSHYLAWFLTSADAQEQLGLFDRGATRAGLGLKDIAALQVPLPPLAEQRRIVARIEALFARTRQARADLLRVAPLSSKLKKEAHRRLLSAEQNGWSTTSVGEVATILQYGTSAKTSGDVAGVPVLRMGNIVDGEVETNNFKYLPHDHHEFPELLLHPGDILFNRTNSAELVGKSAVFGGAPEPCSFASYLIRLRVRGVRPSIIAAYINSPAGREWAASVTSQQVGQANINGAKLRALRIPVIPWEEQDRVDQALAAASTTAKRMSTEATRALALLDHLERSILARAFRGGLVPQDPTDEPAALALARAGTSTPATSRLGRRRAA